MTVTGRQKSSFDCPDLTVPNSLLLAFAMDPFLAFGSYSELEEPVLYLALLFKCPYPAFI